MITEIMLTMFGLWGLFLVLRLVAMVVRLLWEPEYMSYSVLAREAPEPAEPDEIQAAEPHWQAKAQRRRQQRKEWMADYMALDRATRAKAHK